MKTTAAILLAALFLACGSEGPEDSEPDVDELRAQARDLSAQVQVLQATVKEMFLKHGSAALTASDDPNSPKARIDRLLADIAELRVQFATTNDRIAALGGTPVVHPGAAREEVPHGDR